MKLKFFLFSFFLFSDVFAGSILTKDNFLYEGAVKKIREKEIEFLWLPKEGERKFEDEEDFFKVRVGELTQINFPLDKIEKINNLPVNTYILLRKYNPFYTILQNYDTIKLHITTGGTWVEQIKRVFLLIIVTIIIIPLIFFLLTFIIRNPLSISGSFVYAVLITIGMLGFITVCKLMVFYLPIMNSKIGVSLLTLIGVLFISLMVHTLTKYNFFHGILFVIFWSLGMFLSGRILNILIFKI